MLLGDKGGSEIAIVPVPVAGLGWREGVVVVVVGRPFSHPTAPRPKDPQRRGRRQVHLVVTRYHRGVVVVVVVVIVIVMH